MRNYETKIFNYIDKNTGAHVVKAATMYAGKTVSAFSKCDPSDTFDLEFGTKVALKRLDIKIAQKRQASMKQYADFCRSNLELIKYEKRRVKKALVRAEVAAKDREVELNTLQTELNELLSNI